MPYLRKSSSPTAPATETQRNNIPATSVATTTNSPFTAGAAARIAVVVVLFAILWLAVLWAMA
jgi:hypothetical protein